MPAYHSSFVDVQDVRLVGNMAILPLKTAVRGPAPTGDPAMEDIVDETLTLFRANCFFRNFEIKGPSDRVLIYLTLFLQECLGKLSLKSPSLLEAQKLLLTHALQTFPLPGDAQFPLNSLFEKPANRADGDLLKAYLSQARQELVNRFLAKVYVDDKPSKRWMCFSKRKFMGLAGVGTAM